MPQLTDDHFSSTAPFANDGGRPRDDSNKVPFSSPSTVGARNYGNEFGPVSFPDLSLFVKYGASNKVSIDEARTLRALGRAFPDGGVPVPRFYGWRCEEGVNVIYMSLVPGVTLGGVWEKLVETEKEHIVSQLKDAMACLRSLEPSTSERLIGM